MLEKSVQYQYNERGDIFFLFREKGFNLLTVFTGVLGRLKLSN